MSRCCVLQSHNVLFPQKSLSCYFWQGLLKYLRMTFTNYTQIEYSFAFWCRVHKYLPSPLGKLLSLTITSKKPVCSGSPVYNTHATDRSNQPSTNPATYGCTPTVFLPSPHDSSRTPHSRFVLVQHDQFSLTPFHNNGRTRSQRDLCSCFRRSLPTSVVACLAVQ